MILPVGLPNVDDFLQDIPNSLLGSWTLFPRSIIQITFPDAKVEHHISYFSEELGIQVIGSVAYLRYDEGVPSASYDKTSDGQCLHISLSPIRGLRQHWTDEQHEEFIFQNSDQIIKDLFRVDDLEVLHNKIKFKTSLNNLYLISN